MFKIKCMTLFAGFSLVLFSCFDPIDKKLLLGDWQGVEWRVGGQEGQIDASSATFSFQPGGKYTYTYNGAEEKGKYFVSNRELITTPEGGIKMMVKITKLTQDSLTFDMNRGGQSETLTLIKTK